jgi:8-oxo-dGTP diphosphatase
MPFFESIIYQTRSYNFDSATRDIHDFMVEAGVDGAKWDATFNSFGVKNKSRNATMLWNAYQIDSTPMVGVGGKFEAEEMPEECMMREVKEETGLTLTSYRARGVITFISNEWGTEYMHLFTADQFTGEMTDCDEGELVWVPKKEIKDLKLWEGDKIFLRLLDECEEYFSLKLVYEGDTLVDKKLIIAGKEQKAE